MRLWNLAQGHGLSHDDIIYVKYNCENVFGSNKWRREDGRLELDDIFMGQDFLQNKFFWRRKLIKSEFSMKYWYRLYFKHIKRKGTIKGTINEWIISEHIYLSSSYSKSVKPPCHISQNCWERQGLINKTIQRKENRLRVSWYLFCVVTTNKYFIE